MPDAPRLPVDAREPSLATLLEVLAHRLTPRRLLLLLLATLAPAVALLALDYTRWPLAALFLGGAGFAGWGLALRAHERVARWPQRDAVAEGALRALAVTCAALGGLAVLAALIALSVLGSGPMPHF